MVNTSPSLLERLRRPNDQAAWERFVELYTPLLYHWARRTGLQSSDAADLVQEVFAVLVRKMPAFIYDRHRSFRAWLRTVTLNKWRERRRRRTPPTVDENHPALADLASPEDPGGLDEAEYREHLTRRALQLVQAEFPPATWKAAWEVMTGRPPAEVAAELGMGVAAVYTAKSRVLRRLRQEFDGLLD